MNPVQLLAHFDRVAEAPEAVPRLRRFILDLAVRAKLVEQNPHDEPASELLKRIRSNKGKGTERRGGTRESPRDASGDGTLFDIPASWEWVRSTEPAVVISDRGKKVQTKDVLEFGEFPVVDQGKLLIRGYCNDAQKVIRVDAPIIVFGDHTRETKLIDFDFVVGADGVKLLRPVEVDPAYYFLALQWLPLESRGYGRHFKLLRASFFPLPPLAEQHRIVAKVDGLMALCDGLEAAQAKREKRRDRLVAATLHGLSNGDASPAPGARFTFQHLPRLTTRPEHIHQLRQTILNLALRGKLVPQDPIKGSIDKSLRDSHEDARTEEISFPIPTNWIRISVAQLVREKMANGISIRGQEYPPGVRALKLNAITRWGIDDSIVRFLPLPISRARPLLLEAGDFLLARGNGSRDLVARGAVVTRPPDEPTIFPDTMIRVRFKDWVSVEWFKHMWNSPLIRRQIEKRAKTAVGLWKVSQDQVGKIIVPLPPLAEQHRIVAKVDELMALCDALEAQLTTTATTSRQLLEAALHEALRGDV